MESSVCGVQPTVLRNYLHMVWGFDFVVVLIFYYLKQFSGRQMQGDLYKFSFSLINRVSSRKVKTTQRKPYLDKQTKKVKFKYTLKISFHSSKFLQNLSSFL